ncbi:MAG: hypothetical protein ABSH34_19700 [Verrucomicrobiota bacterium]|jgi:hypothetical protein
MSDATNIRGILSKRRSSPQTSLYAGMADAFLKVIAVESAGGSR